MIKTFNPDEGQLFALSNVDMAYLGGSPSIGCLNTIFGEGTTETWLIGQIANLCEFCGSKDAMTQWQITSLTDMLTAMFPWLKMSELLLFFARFKMGWYGHFYGNVDPMRISWALHKFVEQRDKELYAIEARRNAEREAEEAKKFHCTYEEYLQLKNKKADEQGTV